MESKFESIRNAEDASMLNGIAFEYYLAQLFELLGYRSTVTKSSGDFGGDVLLETSEKKVIVQAKQYKSEVGFDAVKEAHFAKSYYAADEAWVVTTSSFTKQASDGANAVGIRLIDGDELTRLIAESRNGGLSTGLLSKGRSRKEVFVLNTNEDKGEVILKQYRGDSTHVVVPDGVNVLGIAAFVGEGVKVGSDKLPFGSTVGLKRPYCKSELIREVTLPSTLVRIEESCFRGCVNLQKIDLPSRPILIESQAFNNCGFTEVALLSGVTYSHGAYGLNKKLKSVSVQHGVDEIPESCFVFCSSLVHVHISSTVTHISDSAFGYCSGLKSIDIPEGVKSIGRRAFCDCTSLVDVTLPLSLTEIYRDAFSRCPVVGDQPITDVFNLDGVTIYDEKGRPLSVLEIEQDAEIQAWKKSCPRDKDIPYFIESHYKLNRYIKELIHVDADLRFALHERDGYLAELQAMNGLRDIEVASLTDRLQGNLSSAKERLAAIPFYNFAKRKEASKAVSQCEHALATLRPELEAEWSQRIESVKANVRTANRKAENLQTRHSVAEKNLHDEAKRLGLREDLLVRLMTYDEYNE